MRPLDVASDPLASPAARPRWGDVLHALREVRGVTQEGWAARLGVGRRTVQRWERGERAPDPGAETAILAYCREAGLFRPYDRGPLAGLGLTAELLQDLLAEARWRVGGGPAEAGPSPDLPAVGQTDGTQSHGARTSLSNLPAHLTSFIGRERELAAVRRAQASTRLITLTGPGGGGKTRLALALAGELLWAYPHGVWFVNLAPLADAALLPQVVASALEIRTSGPQPLTETLTDVLRARHLLVVLDNCEHLLPACAELVETLLRACPHLEVVATSRESLGIDGEAVWPVPPMAVPSRAPGDAELGPRTPDLEASDAVRLFLDRARLRRPAFALTPADAGAVAEICRRLDGMPLAVELAAARVNVLSVAQIADRLHDRFRLLTGGGRTTLPRHRTLRAAMDWSHDLLTGPERAALRALSVFAGGFALEAAEAVCAGVAADGRTAVVTAADVLDLLARLVDKSLVIADEHGGVTRYRMLETVREYAAEQLDGAGEATATRERHAAWCLDLAEAALSQRTGPEQTTWMERLTVEHDNLRAGLGWCLADEHGTLLGLRLGGVLAWFWEARGHAGEGRRWLEALLARGGDAPPDVRARALHGAGALASLQGDVDQAARLVEQSLALRRELGDEAAIAHSLNGLGIAVGARGDHTHARALFEESLALARKLADPSRIAISLNNLGIVARQQGDLDQAVARFEEGLKLLRELEDTRSVATTLLNLGNVHLDQGAPDRAAARYRESLSLYRELQDRLGVARCLEGMAEIAGTCGDAGRAGRLCGAAAALRAAIGVQLPVGRRANVERTTAVARAALGEADFTAAWAAGQAMSLEQAIAEALADVAPV